MINALEYKEGNIQVKIDGHRHILTSAKTVNHIDDDGNSVPHQILESDVSNELPIVKAAAQAVFPLTTRTEGVARFNEKTGLVKYNGQQITPESDLTALPEDIQAFCEAIRTPSTLSTYEGLKPPVYETDDVPGSKIEIRNGKPVLVPTVEKRVRTRKVRVKNEDGTPAFRGKEPLFYNEPIVKP